MGRTQRILVFLAAGIVALSTGAASAQVALWEMKDATDSMGGESNLTLVNDFDVGTVAAADGIFISRWLNAANSDGFAASEGPDFGFGWVPVDPGHELMGHFLGLPSRQ